MTALPHILTPPPPGLTLHGVTPIQSRMLINADHIPQTATLLSVGGGPKRLMLAQVLLLAGFFEARPSPRSRNYTGYVLTPAGERLREYVIRMEHARIACEENACAFLD